MSEMKWLEATILRALLINWEGNMTGAVFTPIKVIIDGEEFDGKMITRKDSNETRKHIEADNEGEQGSHVAA